MAQRKIVIKECDRCGIDPAITRNYEWFGVRYEIDVCDSCDDELKGALKPWIMYSRTTTRSLAPLRTRRLREAEAAPRQPVVEVRQDQPGVHENWTFTQHALEQAEERGIDVEEARRVAAHPDSTGPSAMNPVIREHYGQGLVVVVNPDQKRVVTVVRPEDRAVAL